LRALAMVTVCLFARVACCEGKLPEPSFKDYIAF
jgi:hypothetical protein